MGSTHIAPQHVIAALAEGLRVDKPFLTKDYSSP